MYYSTESAILHYIIKIVNCYFEIAKVNLPEKLALLLYRALSLDLNKILYELQNACM